MNAWLWAADGLLLCLAPTGVVCFRGTLGDRLAGLQMGSTLVVLTLVLLAQGFDRSPFYDVPLTLVILSVGGGLVFARFAQRWL
ncbi:MAG: monovalent cation/H+ antiporter complex subunit F [Tepidisphaeraceae bacterium]